VTSFGNTGDVFIVIERDSSHSCGLLTVVYLTGRKQSQIRIISYLSVTTLYNSKSKEFDVINFEGKKARGRLVTVDNKGWAHWNSPKIKKKKKKKPKSKKKERGNRR